MERTPRILAGFVQSTLSAIDELDAALGARVRERLPAESRRAIEDASGIAWLPIARDVEVTEALFEAAGPARAREIFRRNLASTFEAPVLRTLIQGGLKLLGTSPGRLLSWSPRVYTLLFRDAGEICFVEEGRNAGRIEMRDLPPELVARREYFEGSAAAISAVFDLLRTKGEVRLDAIDPVRRSASFRIEWEPDARG